MIEIGTYTIDLLQLSSILGWMFVGGGLGLIGSILLIFLFTFLSTLNSATATVVSALGILIFGIVATACKYVCFVGGIGWLAVWILTAAGV